MVLNLALLAVGFLILTKGAGWLVDGASSLAKRLGVSSLMIGLTVVAFGTSTPELIVNLFASAQGRTDLAIGNILGSNIFNIFLILGIAAAIVPLTVKRSTVWKEIPMSLLGALVVGILASDRLFAGQETSVLSRGDGIILLFFFVIFLYYTFGISRVEGEEPEVKKFPPGRSLGMVALGLAALVLGGRAIVEGATGIARSFGASEVLIGLTIVAVGTSLPELATSVVAARRKQTDIAIGNVVGSNIFNAFFVLGVSSVIRPLPFASALTFDLVVTALASVVLFATLFVGKRHILERWQGPGLIAVYVLYVGYLIVRG